MVIREMENVIKNILVIWPCLHDHSRPAQVPPHFALTRQYASKYIQLSSSPDEISIIHNTDYENIFDL